MLKKNDQRRGVGKGKGNQATPLQLSPWPSHSFIESAVCVFGIASIGHYYCK